jgi:hypothetical protein
MRKSLTLLAACVSLLGLANVASADCYGFRGKDVVVCVHGSDNSARRQAESVCEDATGSSCSISGVVGSTCQEGSSRQCYDESGNRNRRLTGY